MSHRGLLIAFEGIDRAGKSTQARLLQQNLIQKNNIKTELIAFPKDNTPLGQLIRNILSHKIPKPDSNETMHYLFTANRWENNTYIQKTLSHQEYIILDRYSISGQVYSMSNGLSKNWVQNAEKNLLKPDFTIFLNTHPKEAANRKDYGKDIYENIEYQTIVYNNYLKFRDDTWIVIDTQNKNISQISEIIYSTLMQKINDSTQIIDFKYF